jgi:predicted flap endonuclease-1-like 5' DNA nuclease
LKDGIAGKGECESTATAVGTDLLLYHNSGMIFWKKNDRTKALFELWGEEWRKFGGWDEQVALLRALLRSEVLFLTVPYTWNHSEPRNSFLVTHWFGAGDARIDLKPRVRDVKAVLADRRKTKPPVMSIVKIAGGQYVKCTPGEEEEIRARLMNNNHYRRKEEVVMANRGPMVKVMRGRGQYVKMYQKDAEALGLEYEPEGRRPVATGTALEQPEAAQLERKMRSQVNNKMMEPEGNKTGEERLLRSARNDKGQRPVALGTALEREQGSPEPLHFADASGGRSAREAGQLEDFTVISGVGKATNEKLHEEGIHTFEDLLEADVSFLPGAAQNAIETWRASVSRRLALR